MFGGMWVVKNDTEITLRKNIETKQEESKAHFDKMFKVISQIAEIPTEHMNQSKQAFKEIYEPLIEGRYKDEGEVMMRWIQESNPAFDISSSASLFKNLQIVVEAQREGFFNTQRSLLDIHREHETFCSTFMNKNLFGMGNRTIPKCSDSIDSSIFCVMIITSDYTDSIFQSGKEDNINLYK